MKRSIAWLLCAALLAALLAGCSGEKKALAGTWSGTADLSQPLNEQVAAALGEELAGYFSFPEFTMACRVTFIQQGTYSVCFEEDSVHKAVESIRQGLETGMYAYTEDLLAKEGISVSVEAFLELNGTSMQALLEQALGDPDRLVDDLMAESTLAGNFTAKQGRLMLSDSEKKRPEETAYYTYTLEGDCLTIGQGTADIGFPCPLVLTKAN